MTALVALAWLAAALALLALGITLLNAVGWARGRPDGGLPGRVSVLVPARDEVANIRACVEAIAASTHPVHEIVVVDDGSTDGTAEVLAALVKEQPRLRVIQGVGLPPGWVGKPHACHRLAAEATGDWLVFLDADVRLDPGGLARIGALVHDHGADVVTAVPRQVTGSLVEQVVMPFLIVTYVSWLPLFLIPRTLDPRVLAANGQVLAVRRSAYEVVGGFGAVRRAVVDDMAFCRRAKERGLTVVFADGTAIASCRMYGSAAEVWRGFSKNLYEGLGESAPALAFVMGLYGMAFVAPWLALAVAGAAPALLVPGAVGVGANLAQRLVIAARHRLPAWSALTHPLGAAAVIAIAANSWRWSRRGRVAWRGRVYASLREREARS